MSYINPKSLTFDFRRQQFHEPNDELEEELLGEEYITVQETLASVAAALPPVQLASEPSKPFGRGPCSDFEALDFKALVGQRREHQTRQAANCARIKHAKSTDDSPAATEESVRRRILRRFHEILKEDQTRAVGTGAVRKAHWETDPKPAAGNSANAAAAATSVAKMVSQPRYINPMFSRI